MNPETLVINILGLVLHKKGINSNPVNSELAVAYFIGINMDAMQLKDDPNTVEETYWKMYRKVLWWWL
jgi:hypothetical protein